jgi:hypothetical protein
MDLIYVAVIGKEVEGGHRGRSKKSLELPLKWSTCLRTRMHRMEKVGAT